MKAKFYVKNYFEFKNLLEINSYTQKKFSEEVGISETYFSLIVNGHKNVGVKTAKKIANKLNRTIDSIFILR